jgi:hypothetical protein
MVGAGVGGDREWSTVDCCHGERCHSWMITISANKLLDYPLIVNDNGSAAGSDGFHHSFHTFPWGVRQCGG